MTPIEIGALVVLVFAVAAVATVVVRAWAWFAGPRVVVCPDNGRPAGVELDVRYGVTAALVGAPGLRLRSCSRWPEKQHCGQECLVQVEDAPDDCRVRSVLRRFYVGQSCVVCAKPFDPIAWHDHKPAIQRPDGMTVEWADLRAEQLEDVLATAQPVCWSCHVALRFRREHPELVIERPHLDPKSHPHA